MMHIFFNVFSVCEPLTLTVLINLHKYILFFSAVSQLIIAIASCVYTMQLLWQICQFTIWVPSIARKYSIRLLWMTKLKNTQWSKMSKQKTPTIWTHCCHLTKDILSTATLPDYRVAFFLWDSFYIIILHCDTLPWQRVFVEAIKSYNVWII